jgi:hypothetical protein
MKYTKGIQGLLIAILILGTSMNAFGFLGFGNSAKWKEEVLLHNGQKIIVERSQTRGGRHEIGQEVPIAKHTVSFSLPGTNRPITWESEFGMEPNKLSLILLALDVVNNIPYLVTTPARCIAYNKWGRPNPPYVFFRYDGKRWQQIQMGEVPAAIKEANVVIGTQRMEQYLTESSVPVPADEIKRINAEAKSPDVRHLRIFVREPIKVPQTVECVEMVYCEDGTWLSIDWFTSVPTYEACLKVCERKKVSLQHCPCNRIFNNKKGK